MDVDPIFCEVTIRRLERFRKAGKAGWQNSNPFEEELHDDSELRELIQDIQPISEQPQPTLF
jgi:site-specific DNA-methyltransferase (adenine-specific)